MEVAIRDLRDDERAWANAVYAEIGFAPSTPRDTLLVAEQNHSGVALGRLVPIGGGAVELGGIWTAPEARGVGVARAIVTALLARANTAASVWCIPYTHLVGFYESCGLAPAAPPWPDVVAEKVRGLRERGTAVAVLVRVPLLVGGAGALPDL